jgi:hypothetical protein
MAAEESQDEAGTRRGDWWLIAGLLALLLVLGLVVLWVRTPALYGTGDAAKTATATTRGAILTVAAALIAATAAGAGLYMTARTIRVNQRTLSETQRANRASEERAREAQVTDRYTKAVEQLGNEKLDVRLGGIYALERLMVDSERDHPTTIEVLAAFLREHATTPISATSTAWPLPVGSVAEEKNVAPTPMPADTAAAARVIARRPPGRVERGHLDLRRCYLSRVDLSGADLSDANLAGANLAGANLSEARNLAREQLKAASTEEATLPDYLKDPS